MYGQGGSPMYSGGFSPMSSCGSWPQSPAAQPMWATGAPGQYGAPPGAPGPHGLAAIGGEIDRQMAQASNAASAAAHDVVSGVEHGWQSSVALGADAVAHVERDIDMAAARLMPGSGKHPHEVQNPYEMQMWAPGPPGPPGPCGPPAPTAAAMEHEWLTHMYHQTAAAQVAAVKAQHEAHRQRQAYTQAYNTYMTKAAYLAAVESPSSRRSRKGCF